MRALNLDQIRAFLAVCRSGGVQKAAQHLNLTQPAVTTRIRKLEDSLGVSLFERQISGMKLTKRGELLLQYAEQFERLADRVEEVVVAPEGIDRRLRVGASETVAQCWLPDLVSALHRKFPRLEVDINVDISVNLRAALLAREIDLAILLGPISEYSVDNVTLPGFELAWFVAADAADPAEGAHRLFEDKPVISYARNTRPWRELKSLLFDRVGPDVSVFPSSSLSACFRLVEAGLGVAALPRVLGHKLVREGSIREFDPGWKPSELRFSASYLGDPHDHMVEAAAELSQTISEAWHLENDRRGSAGDGKRP
ncbi:DNA-binding transcriptional LysR family regulator [Breoghania corrubedonensis]|uniref:DNA-binding transcriptional LysR family regulator n=1 Tax=Breoghania corrubedonensis TaxID=665038 RepID=A0A2T5UYP5_9HYPH|nr:LysR family transcriptional regulator [Breoghania corrubedonensis]PTW56623.1 DNA-binding transcriptional LysR family regulator [Breoghania corrubedonensis]